MVNDQKIKAEVRERDGQECQFCGMSREAHKEQYGQQLHVHHIVPKRAQGGDSRQNLVTVCAPCHRQLETTQAKAVANLKGELRQLAEDVAQPTTPEEPKEIVEGDSYEHKYHGKVTVFQLRTNIVSASTDGVKHRVVVEFKPLDSGEKYAESVEQFAELTGKGARQPSRLEKVDWDE